MTWTDKENAVIAEAIEIITGRARLGALVITSPEAARNLFRLELARDPNEIFAAAWLDNRHRLIRFQRLFAGTIDGASVHPRVVVQQAIRHNAAAVMFGHNHPSGIAEPSLADRNITGRLIETLKLIDVRVLDHIIIGEGEPLSMAERGLL